MSKAWSWFLCAIWLLALFGGLIPREWRPAVMAVPVCFMLAGVLYYDGDGLYRPPGFAALAGWFGLLLFQIMPLPPAVLSFFSPGAYNLYSETVWVVQPGSWLPLAPVTRTAFLAIMQLWLLGGIFLTTTMVGAEHASLGKILRSLGLFLGVLALIAAVNVLLQGGGFSRWNLPPAVPVTFAALLPLVLACHLYAKPHQNYGKWSERLQQALRHPVGHLHGYLLVASIIMGLVVVAVGAPELQVALVCGLLLMTTMYLCHRGCRSSSAAAVVLTLILLVVVGVGRRYEHRSVPLSIAAPQPLSLNIHALVKDFLPVGGGLGNLHDLKMRYTHPAEPSAENALSGAWLGTLVEGGLVGGVLTLWFWMAVLIAGVAGWLKRRNRMAMFLLPGVFAGLIVCFVFSSGPQQSLGPWPGLPGYFLAALLIAIGCFSSTGDVDVSIGIIRPVERWIMIFISGLFALMGVIYVSGKVGVLPDEPVPSFADAPMSSAVGADPGGKLDKYLLFDPLNDAYWFAAGNYWAGAREDQKALTGFNRALRLNPLAGEPVYRLGVLLDGRGQGLKGQRLMQAGLKNAPFSAELRRDYLLYLLTKGEEEKALTTLPELLLLAPEQTGFWLRYFEGQDIGQPRWLDYLPRRAEVYWQYGEYLANRQESRAAEDIFKKSVTFAAREPRVSADLFLNIAGYFMANDHFEAALEVLRAGMEARPDDVTLLLTTAGIYHRLGIIYRAEELYRKVLLLDPDNSEVRSRLDNL
jgi:tetratricopeptide (TPR) repeat protein